MLTIGKLAKQFNLSRSTLLYYDSIGLLKPTGRSEAGYRFYNEDDVEKLRGINLYKEMGLSLTEIQELLLSDNNVISAPLLKRLGELNEEVKSLRRQQDAIIKLLKDKELLLGMLKTDDEVLKPFMEKAGIPFDETQKWHAAFEKYSPEQHRSFLESLGISEEDIEHIINWAREII